MAYHGFRRTKRSGMLESELQPKVLELLEEEGYYAVKIISCNRSGWMDIVACSPTGMFIGIELKVGNNTPSDLQKIHIQEVLKRGGIAFAAWSLADVKEGLAKGRRDDGTDQIDSAPPLL